MGFTSHTCFIWSRSHRCILSRGHDNPVWYKYSERCTCTPSAGGGCTRTAGVKIQPYGPHCVACRRPVGAPTLDVKLNYKVFLNATTSFGRCVKYRLRKLKAAGGWVNKEELRRRPWRSQRRSPASKSRRSPRRRSGHLESMSVARKLQVPRR